MPIATAASVTVFAGAMNVHIDLVCCTKNENKEKARPCWEAVLRALKPHIQYDLSSISHDDVLCRAPVTVVSKGSRLPYYTTAGAILNVK